MSSPESVSSRTARSGSRRAIWRISFRFFSPPENPRSDTAPRKHGSISSRFIHSIMVTRISSDGDLGSLAGRQRLAEELRDRDARDLLGVLEGEEHAGLRAHSAGQLVMSSPLRGCGPT